MNGEDRTVRPARGRFSVIIPHYGDPSLAGQLVADLRAQSRPAHQVIVVDDASPLAFPDGGQGGVHVVKRDANGGFGAAVNSGAQAAEGEFLVILNSDLRIGPEFLECLGAIHDRNPGALIGPQVRHADGRISWSCRRFPTVRTQAWQFLRIFTGAQYGDRYQGWTGMDVRQWRDPEEDIPAQWIVGAALSVPRDIFVEVGGFCEEYTMYSEEVDIQFHLARRNVPRIYSTSVSVVHAGGGSSASGPTGQWEQRSRFVYARRWGRPTLLAVTLTAVCLLNIGIDSVKALRGRKVAPLATARSTVRTLWSMWWETRSIPRMV